jgi:glutathione S-transferase
MSPTITAFKQSPDGGQGQARDMRVRWALEEVGLAYDVRLVTFGQMKEPAHLAMQPFGQIPSFEDGDLKLFESGAIVLHLAENHMGLLSRNKAARGRAIAWMFAALNTVEPPIVELEQSYFSAGKKAWYAEYRAIILERVHDRLDRLSCFLGDAEWLDGAFSAADLMMVMVLRRAEGEGILESYPNLLAYMARGTARPAYQRAFAAQAAVFRDAQER